MTMNFTITYKLWISLEAYTKAAEKLKLPNYFQNDWIDYEQGNPEHDEEDCIIINYPNIKYPELSRDIFFGIVCLAYPLSRYPEGKLLIEAEAQNGGKEAIRFQDVFAPGIADSYCGTFRYNGEVFAQDLQNKLDKIKKIINN